MSLAIVPSIIICMVLLSVCVLSDVLMFLLGLVGLCAPFQSLKLS